MYQPPPEQPRQKIPKDGPGPRGVPDVYYTSRVLNSTGRYAKFVRKLRMFEEEQRKGDINKHNEHLNRQISEFFMRCDRRSLVNNVKRRVDLCLRSYDDDINKKRQRLSSLFKHEEEENIRKFVIQAQEGTAAIWKDKMDRLEYLLAKRQKEHEEKYKDTPISKAAHVLPCIYKLRAKEAEEIQLYQMREKQARKMSEREFDNMWHEVAMKESEALSARMEYDAIERFRRDLECKAHSDQQMEQRREQQRRDRERLKQEQLAMKARFEEDERKEQEAERMRQERQKEITQETNLILEERRMLQAKQEAEAALIREAWDSLAGQGLSENQAKLDRMRQKEKELDICNKKMIELREEVKHMDDKHEALFKAAAENQQAKDDKRRCEYSLWSKNTNRDVRKAMLEQIKDNQLKREKLQQDIDAENEYFRQLRRQQDELIEYQKKEDAELRKRYQSDLQEQLAYNNLLKERARQEEADQLEKGRQAAQDYKDEMQRMLCRPFFSEEVHPFMKQMAKGLKMTEKCPCAKADYCK